MSKGTRGQQPQKTGDQKHYFVEFESQKFELKHFLHFSLVEGKVILSDTLGDSFSLFLNNDVISIVPRVDVKINKKKILINKMYILDESDSIECEKVIFRILKESKKLQKPYINNEKKDRTQEIQTDDSPPELTAQIKSESTNTDISLVQDSSETSVFEINDLLEEAGTKIEDDEVVESLDDQLKEKIKKEPVKASAALKVSSKKRKNLTAANSIYRIFALFIEFGFILLIHQFTSLDVSLIPFNESMNVDLDVLGMQLTSDLIYQGASFFFSFYILRVLSASIFGVSFGQLCLGFYTGLGGVEKRIKGFFRELIGIFTFQFIIFDLPALVSKRTVKELFTRSEVQSRSFLMSLLLFIVFFSVMSISWLSSPFMSYYNPDKIIDVQMLNSPKPIKGEEQSDIKGSEYLGLSVPASMETLVVYKKKRVKGRLSFYPEVEFIKKDNSLKLGLSKKVYFFKTIKESMSYDPLSFSSYPELTVKFLSNNIDKSVRPKINQVTAYRETHKLVQRAFSINADSFIDQLVNLNPFIKGSLVLRKNIESIAQDPISSIEFYKGRADLFILLNHKSSKGVGEKTMIGFEEQSRVFKLKASKKSMSKVFKTISFIAPKGKQLYSMLTQLDHMFVQMSPENLQKAYDFNFGYLKNKLDRDKLIYKSEIIGSFQSQLDFLNLKYKAAASSQSLEKYIQNMSDSLQAFKEEDKAFFGLDLNKTAKVDL